MNLISDLPVTQNTVSHLEQMKLLPYTHCRAMSSKVYSFLRGLKGLPSNLVLEVGPTVKNRPDKQAFFAHIQARDNDYNSRYHTTIHPDGTPDFVISNIPDNMLEFLETRFLGSPMDRCVYERLLENIEIAHNEGTSLDCEPDYLKITTIG